MPPPTQTQDRLARAQQPFSPSSYSRPTSGKGKMPFPTPTAAASTSASAFGLGAPEEQEKEEEGEEEEEEDESNEMWESRQNRIEAATVLGSWEQLAWQGIAARESIPQTQLAFQKRMLGISSPASDVEWSDDYYGEQDVHRLQQEQREGGTAAGSAREGKGAGRGGSPMGKGGRASSKRR